MWLSKEARTAVTGPRDLCKLVEIVLSAPTRSVHKSHTLKRFSLRVRGGGLLICLLGTACLRSPPLEPEPLATDTSEASAASDSGVTSMALTTTGGEISTSTTTGATTTTGSGGSGIDTTTTDGSTSDTSGTGTTSDDLCGNDILDEGEECDDGDQDDSDECPSSCTFAHCGDGFIQSGVEHCEDGNIQSGDGCSSKCEHEYRVFVSSLAYLGNLSPTNANEVYGLDRGDANCQALAFEAGLQGDFRAWLSDSTGSPSSRFELQGPAGEVDFLLVDGSLVAESWSDIVDGSLAKEIDLDESGEVMGGVLVWTSTTTAGSAGGTEHCNDWASASNVYATVGNSSQSGENWTDYKQYYCSQEFHLYCFQVAVDG